MVKETIIRIEDNGRDNDHLVASIEKIGSGAHWDVYLIILSEPLTIDVQQYGQIICKIPKKENDLIEDNFKIFTIIRESDLPSLDFIKIGILLNNINKEVIITENLNCGEKLFVSPNSIRKKKNNSHNCDQPQEYEGSEAEIFLSKHKIKKICNFEEFVTQLFLDMERAAKNCLSMYFDAFFFGVERGKRNVNLTYKVADFDSIISIEGTDEKFLKFKKLNIEAAYEAALKFLDIFVSYKNLSDYKLILEDKLKEIRANLKKKKSHNQITGFFI